LLRHINDTTIIISDSISESKSIRYAFLMMKLVKSYVFKYRRQYPFDWRKALKNGIL